MLSAIMAIAVAVAAAAGIIVLINQFIPSIFEWIDWGQNLAAQLLDYIPFWLLPFASVMLVLAFVGLGVKLL